MGSIIVAKRPTVGSLIVLCCLNSTGLASASIGSPVYYLLQMSKLVITITGWEINVAYKVNNNKEIECLAVVSIVKTGVKISRHKIHFVSRATLAGE